MIGETVDTTAIASYMQTHGFDEMASYIHDCFSKAVNNRSNITARLIRAVHAANLNYAPATCPEGDPDVYSGLIANKSRQAEAWLRSVLMGAIENLWTVESTAKPTLSDMDYKLIEEEVQKEAQEAGVTQEQLASMRAGLQTLIEKRIKELADQKTTRLATYIRDIIDETQFRDALKTFLITLTQYPYAVLQAPVKTVRATIAYDEASPSKVTVKTVNKVDIIALDPISVYWSGDGATLQACSHVIVDSMVTVDQLLDAAEDEHSEFRLDAVDAIASSTRVYDANAIPRDEYLLKLRADEPPYLAVAGNKRCLKFYGRIKGELLIKFAKLSPETLAALDARRYYESEVWVVEGLTVLAKLSDAPLGMRGIYSTSLYSKPNSIVGNGMADVLHDLERIVNSANRQILLNMPLSAVPILEVARERITNIKPEDAIVIKPRMVIETETDMLNDGRSALEVHRIDTNAAEFMRLAADATSRADIVSGIPAHVAGTLDVASMARTEGGLAMLMKAATLLMQNMVSNIDSDILSPMLANLYNMIMLYSEDPDVKADAAVKAKGVSGVLQMEVGQAKLQTLLTIIAPFANSGIVPPQLLVNLLRQIITDLGYDPDKIVPSNMASAAIEFQSTMSAAKITGMTANPQATGTPAISGVVGK